MRGQFFFSDVEVIKNLVNNVTRTARRSLSTTLNAPRAGRCALNLLASDHEIKTF